jgi:dihydrofolate reductase
MNAIVIVDKNWGIGKSGQLLVHLPGDLKYFKEKTLGNTIIMGRETFDSMGGRLLPGRESVILSRNEKFNPGCQVCKSLEETLEYIKDKPSEKVFIAGGETVYKLFLPYCDKFFVTKIYEGFEADRHFPNLDEQPENFKVISESEVALENGIKYQFFEYARIY